MFVLKSLYGLSDIISGQSTETCETTVRRRSGVERWRRIGSRRTDVGDLLVKKNWCASSGPTAVDTEALIPRPNRVLTERHSCREARMFRVDFRLPEVLSLLAQQLTVFTSPCVPRFRRRVHSRQVVIKPWIRLCHVVHAHDQ